MTKKLTPKQITKWLDSLPETTLVWATMCADSVTIEQVKALDERRSEYRRAAAELHSDLERLDSSLYVNADTDAGENMPPELNDTEMLGYYKYFRNHLANAAAVHWESAGRDLNAELGYVAY
jgi:ribonuclease HII